MLTFARYSLEIDGNSRTYRKRFSVVVVTSEKGGSLDKFDTVSVIHRVRRRTSSEGGTRTYTDYPIRLEGPAETLDISSPNILENAQRDAEQVAKRSACRWPIELVPSRSCARRIVWTNRCGNGAAARAEAQANCRFLRKA